MHKYQLLIMLLVVCYAENNSTAVKQQEKMVISEQSKQIKEGVIVFCIVALFAFVAMLLGKSGHNVYQNTVEHQLTELKQQEDENQTSDEKVIAEQIKIYHNKESTVDSNELHMPEGYSISYASVLRQKFVGFKQYLKKLFTSDKEGKELRHLEMYNQFEFEDSI